MKLLRMLPLLCAALPAWAQYVATPQAGVGYPALTSATQVPLAAPGSNDPKDKGRYTLPLGFDFPFYNRVYSQITVTANGVLFLEPSSGANTSSDFPANVAIPNGSEPNGVIAPLWDDLIGSNQTSVVQRQAVTGSNGQGLAVEFKDWSRWPAGYFLTFQVRIWSNGVIEFFYGSMTGMGPTPLSATIGVESPAGTVGTRGLTNCTNDCSLTSFDPTGSGTPINYLRFGPPAGYDLQAVTLTVNSVAPSGSDLSASTTFKLRNFGTTASPTFDYGLYLSEDTIFDPGVDVQLTPAPATHAALPALASDTLTLGGTTPLPDGGTFYLLAVINQDSGETNAFNNVIASSVPYTAGVDLIAESVTPPPVTGPGDTAQVAVHFSNQGIESAGQVNAKLYASYDAELSANDWLLTSQDLSVAGGQQVSQTMSFLIPNSAVAGDYYVILQLDDGPDAGAIVELSDSNNVVSSATRMQVRQADLVVQEVRVLRATPPIEEVDHVFLGEPARFEALVANVGGAVAPDVIVSFYLSENETLFAAGDPRIGQVIAGDFGPGESRWVELPSAVVPSQRLNGTALPVQPYFFFAAAVSAGLMETDLFNNFEHATPVLGRLPAADYAPTEMVAPARAGGGEIVPVTRTFANLGNRDGAPVKYRYYLSANSTITTDDLPVTRVLPTGDVLDGTVTLAVGQTDTASELVRLPANVSQASYYLGVLVDSAGEVDEAEEDNNGLPSSPVQVFPATLGLANTVLPDAVVGLPYSVQLEGTGGNGNYQFSLADPSSLPAGLTLSPTGLISGVPTEAAAGPIIFTVSSNEHDATAALTIRVTGATGSLQLQSAPLPAPIYNVAYRAQLGAVGGAGGYRFAIIDGVLPLGLSLTEGGVLSGTPTDALGTQRAFVVRCTDLAGNTDARAFVMTVIDSAPFSIVTQQVPDGQTGVAYLQLVYAADRLGAAVSLPVRWRVIDGALPPGLALEASMQDNAFLSGTPDRPGRYAFTIEATDAQGRIASHPYVVTIFTAGVTARADGTRIVKPGGEVRVDFTGTSLPSGAKWFLRSGQLPPGTTFSEAGVLTGTVPADAATRLHTFSVSVGLSAAEPLSEVWWTVEVNPVIPTKTGCAATGPELLVLGVLGLLARRRRVTR